MVTTFAGHYLLQPAQLKLTTYGDIPSVTMPASCIFRDQPAGENSCCSHEIGSFFHIEPALWLSHLYHHISYVVRKEIANSIIHLARFQ